MLVFHTAFAVYDDRRGTSTFRSASSDAARVERQQSKLRASDDAMRLKIRAIDIGRQDQVERQFSRSAEEAIGGVRSFQGRTVLCLGARLGGEVRAFKALGALAVGVDVEPGDGNMDVLVGDFEHLAFADASFDFAYSNVLDHVHDLRTFGSEACRVLKPGGMFFAALFPASRDRWSGQQAVSASSQGVLVRKLAPNFALVNSTFVRETMRVRELARGLVGDMAHNASDIARIGPWNQEITTLYLQRNDAPSTSCDGLRAPSHVAPLRKAAQRTIHSVHTVLK